MMTRIEVLNKTMKKILIFLSVTILIVIITGSLVFVYFIRMDLDFWKNAVGNLLATLIGLAAGVPIGLWINRSITNEQIQNRKIAKRAKELEILKSIKTEIENCKLNVFQYRPQKIDSFLGVPYKTITWDVYCASGKIKYISSIELLDQLAFAYHHIKAQDRFEYQVQSAFAADRNTESNQLREGARALDAQFIDKTDTALQSIELKIKELETNPN